MAKLAGAAGPPLRASATPGLAAPHVAQAAGRLHKPGFCLPKDFLCFAKMLQAREVDHGSVSASMGSASGVRAVVHAAAGCGRRGTVQAVDCSRNRPGARRLGFTWTARYYWMYVGGRLAACKHRAARCDGLGTNHSAR